MADQENTFGIFLSLEELEFLRLLLLEMDEYMTPDERMEEVAADLIEKVERSRSALISSKEKN